MANNFGQNRTIEYTYRFNADVREFNRNFNNLTSNIQAAFQAVQNGSETMNKMSIQMHEAANVAAQLRQNLGHAFNIQTGRLDFTKFTQQMREAGYGMQDYVKALQQLGPAGETAFKQLGNAILNSEIQMKRTHPILDKFMNSLGRVALYQFSTRALSLFTQGIREAFQFTEELNSSLNKIRIVTKASTDDMAQFAIKANEAAQALSSTTTAYTDASLIYFQQGLSEEEAIARTNVTLKLANVTGESVKTISNDLTAIWNNFDDGSKNLEYYADVMTKLGATTASSSKEIAAGLEKFAPIAQTVGLSYEYAAAALATVTAETRTSAEVVGTAFKTIFGRLDSLKLGETLEDDIGLTKYTAALESVGVSVMDTNGELRRMDDILNDVGEVWAKIGDAQKTALANTVAGVRQYAQFMALMNNWDTVKLNVEVAEGSEGELQEQQDVYAESWKAASERIKDSLQQIYIMLLNDEGFVTMLNGINEVIKALRVMLKTIGGLPGLLATISNLVFTIKGDVLATSMGKYMESAFLSSKKGIAYQENQRQIAIDALKQQSQNTIIEQGGGSLATDKALIQAPIKAMEQQQKIQHDLIAQKKQMSEEEKGIYQAINNNIKALSEQGLRYSELSAKAKDAHQQALKMAEAIAVSEQNTKAYSQQENTKNNKQQVGAAWNGNGDFLNAGRNYVNSLKNESSGLSSQQIGSLTRSLNQYEKAVSPEEKAKAAEGFRKLIEKYDQAIKDGYEKAIQEQASKNVDNQKIVKEASDKYINNKVSGNQLTRALDLAKDIQKSNKSSQSAAALKQTQEQAVSSVNNFKKAMEDALNSEEGGVGKLTDSAKQAIEDFIKTVNSGDTSKLSGNIKALNDELEKTKENANGALEEMKNVSGEDATQTFKEETDVFINSEFSKQRAAEETSNALEAQKQVGKKTLKEGMKDYQQLSQQMMSVARGISGIVQVYNTIRGAIDTLTDESMSPLEKMMAIFTTMPSLIFGVSSAMQLFTISSKGASGAAGELGIASVEAAAGETAAGAAGAAATPGLVSFGAGMTAAMGPVGWIVAAIAGFIAIVTVAISLIAKFNEEARKNSLDYKISQLNEEVQEANENFATLQENSLKFAETESEYDKLIEKFSKLSSSSDEYKETLIKILKLQNQMYDESTGLDYIRKYYADLGYTYSQIFDTNGLLTELGRSLAEQYETQFQEQSYKRQQQANIQLDLAQKEKNKSNLGNVSDIVTSNLGTFSPQQATRTVASYIANYIQGQTGQQLDFMTEILDPMTGALTDKAYELLRQSIPNLNDTSKWVERAREFGYTFSPDDSYGGARVQEAINNYLKNIFTEEGRNNSLISAISQAILRDDSSYSYDFVKSYDTITKGFLNDYLAYGNIQSVYDTYLKGTVFDASAVSIAYQEAFDKASQEAKNKSTTEEGIEQLTDLLKSKKILNNNDNVVFETATNGEITYKISNSSTKETKEGILQLTEYIDLLSSFDQDIAEAYNNALASISDADTKYVHSLQNKVLESGDWRNLTEQELLDFTTNLGFKVDKSGLDLYTSTETEKLSINERSILYNFEQQNKEFSDELAQLTEAELQALSKMVNDSTLTVSDNFSIAAKLLGTMPEKLSPILKSILEESQTVTTAIVKQFSEDINFASNTDTVAKFLAGEELDQTEFDAIQKYLPEEYSSYIIGENKKGEKTYSIDRINEDKTSDYFNQLIAGAANIKENLTEDDISSLYSFQKNDLKEINKLHRQLSTTLTDENLKQAEQKNYQQQYNKALAQTIENLGITIQEWNYLKNSLEGISDQDLIIHFQLKTNFDDQKKMFEAWQTNEFKENDSNRFNLAASLAEDLDLSAEEVDKFLNSSDGQAILQKFYLGTPEERQAAWEELQAWYRERKILLDIELDYSKKDDELSKILTEAKTVWEGLDTNLSFTAWIQVDNNHFKEQIEQALLNGKITPEQVKDFWAALGVKATWKTQPLPMYDKKTGLPILVDTITEITYEPIESTVAPYDDGGGGGGSKSTPTMYETRRTDSSLRYKDIQNELSDLEKANDKLFKKLQLTWGPDSQDDLDAYYDGLTNIANTYERLANEASNNKIGDRSLLEGAWQSLSGIIDLSSVNISYSDDTGLITNEQEIQDAIINGMNARFAGQTADSTKEADKLIEAFKAYMSDYQTSVKNSIEWTEKLEETLKKRNAWENFYKYQDQYNTELRLTNAQLKDQDNTLKEINRKLTNQNKIISNSAGLKKLAEEDKYIDILHEETAELNKQITIKEDEQDLNKKYLEGLLKRYGIDSNILDVNEDGLLTHAEIVKKLNEEWQALYDILGTSEDVEKFASEILNIVDKIDEGTQSIKDINDKIEDLRLEEQAKNYEKLVERLNNKLQKTKNELTLISYQFSTLSSNFYTMGEAAALFGDQGDKYIENLKAFETHYSELNEAFKNGAISQKDFADGLQSVFDGIMENLDSIEQLDQQVKSYYGQTLQAANAELNAHTAGLARATSTLNHYLSVMQMINRKTDYASLGKVYEGLVKTTKNEYDVAVANYEMLKEQEERAKKDLEQYEGDKTSKAFEIANQKWQDAAAAMDQAYSDMLSKMEAWTQAIVDNFHNTLEKLKQEFEDTMTEGSNFDSVIKQLQRLKTANEEYLTRTNQIYEVNKLAREAEKEMDSQTNAVTKQRLGNFINETNALKDKNKLSNLELEIQKAKYDLLLAEMAIEDARANKNKVRLQRDSEGGYGYVYTAEAEEVSDAIQKYEDAENRLYNIGLENTEKYMEKSYQLAQQMTEELAQVWEDYNSGKIQSEQERDQEILRIEQDFQTKSLAYEELYAIAMNETHEKVVEDSWTSQVKMIGNSEKWSAAMHSYVDKVRLEFKHYEEDLTAANEHVGETAEVTAGKVGEIVTESDNLTTSILGEDGLLKALGLELDTVAGLVEKYEVWRQKIQPIIDQMYAMADGIASVLSAMNGTTQGANGEYIEDYSVEMFKNKSRIAELQKMAPTNEEAAKQLEEALAYEQFLKENREIKRVTNGMSEYDEATVEAIYDILASHGMQDVIQGIENGDVYLKDIVKKYKKLFELYSIESYSTGGYTGDWSDSGKLGILHQKELVLNAEDTQNILSAVGMVRQMDQLLEGFSFGQGLTPGAMQQLVTIHAEFPNVQDHNEIELALNDLVNRASQYVMAR